MCSLFVGIDKLIEPLRTTIQSKAKANSVKQEFEKQDELKRSAMRAIAALLTTPDHGEQRNKNLVHAMQELIELKCSLMIRMTKHFVLKRFIICNKNLHSVR